MRDILAAVTPGGGKSLLPVLAAATLIRASVVERMVWVVPRDSLRLQAEEAFADPRWRGARGHALAVRATANAPDPCRGLAGYVITYQAVAAAPELHLAEARRHRNLLVVDEVHHLSGLAEHAPDPLAEPEADISAGWSRALLPVLEVARLRQLRVRRRALRTSPSGEDAQGLDERGLGKLLVVAPDQEQARRYVNVVQS